jgi:hypothetical protein
MIVEGQAPIDITVFEDSILNEKAHPHVYLEFAPGMSHVGRSDLELLKDDKRTVFAVWLYQLRNLTAHVILADPQGDWDKDRLSCTWHPKFGTNKLIIADPNQP